MASNLSRLFALAFLFLSPLPGHTQTTQGPEPSSQLLKAEELDQLMAPIALYPDALLAKVLMASTYPLEVVEADRWAKANKNLKGEQLKAEAGKQRWDDSVKQLTATPSVLDMMSSQARLDAEARRCGAGSAARRDGFGAAAALARRTPRRNW